MTEVARPTPSAVYAVFAGAIDQAAVQRMFVGLGAIMNNQIAQVHLLLQSSGGSVSDSVCLYNFFRSLPIDLVSGPDRSRHGPCPPLLDHLWPPSGISAATQCQATDQSKFSTMSRHEVRRGGHLSFAARAWPDPGSTLPRACWALARQTRDRWEMFESLPTA